MPPKPPSGPMLTSVEALIRDMPEQVRTGPEALLALTLARHVDAAPVERIAPLTKELRAALAGLREAVNRAGKRGDTVDELRAKRAARRSAAAPAAGSAP